MDEGKSVVTARQRRGAVSLLLAMVLLAVGGLAVWTYQSSRSGALMRLKWRRLLLTSIAPTASECAAIIMSISPMGWPKPPRVGWWRWRGGMSRGARPSRPSMS